MEQEHKDAGSQHKSASRLEAYKATVAFEHAAIRPLFLLNGGGALATLTFLGSIWTKDQGTEAAPDAAVPIIVFGIGLASAAMTSICGYVSQQSFYQGGGIPERMPAGYTPERYNRRGYAARRCAYTFGFISVVAFMMGIVVGYCALK